MSTGSRLHVAVLLSGREQFSDYYGGALARWTYEVYRHLQSEVDVAVFGFPTDPATRYQLAHESSQWWRVCVGISRIPVIRRFESVVWLRALTERLRRFDLVHVHGRPQWVHALRRLDYQRSIVLHLQNDHLGHWTPEMLNGLAPRLDAVVACSDYLAEQFRSKSEALAAKTTIISNGVNTELFYPCEELREPKTILFVGSFIPQKGVLQLVKAYAQVLETHPDARLAIGGSATFGIERETPYTVQVHKLADLIRQRKGVEIQFLGPMHHDKQLPSWFQRATVFTSPSLFQEPFGLVNAEAMACATPVVGTNRGGVPEVVDDAGIVVNPEDTEGYARALSTLLGDSARCRHLGREGHERARTLFDWRVIADRWRSVLLERALNWH